MHSSVFEFLVLHNDYLFKAQEVKLTGILLGRAESM